MNKDNLPDFLIVGAPKAATTTLYHYLTQIPEIYMSPKKSPEYFTKNYPKSFFTRPIKDRKKYISLFKDVKNEKAVGEASVFYLIDPESPKLIKNEILDARIIMILRDPIQRAFSHYLMFYSAGVEKLTFLDRIEKEKKMLEKGFDPESYCLLPSFYYESVKRYFDIFGRNNVKVFIFEEFIKDPKKIVKELLNFINVDCEIPKFEKETYNPFSKPRGKLAQILLSDRRIMPITGDIIPDKIRWRIKEKFLIKEDDKPKISEREKSILKEVFKDDVNKLSNLLERELPWSF